MPASQNLPTVDQIDAAKKLYMHEKLEYWQLQDNILTELRDQDPSLTNQQSTYIKVTLLNTFYNAGCGDVEKMTSWMVDQKPNLLEAYRSTDSHDVSGHIRFVQRIASYGRTGGGSCIVFASKFAHFFLDADVFPIYDQYARMLVHFHIETLEGDEQPRSKYEKFYKKFFQLKQQLEQRDATSYSTKDLDCYLWPAGQYITWNKHCFPKRPFYINERVPFDGSDNKTLFETLFPPAMIEDIPDDLLLSELDWETKKQKEAWKKNRREEKSNGTQT